MSGGEGGGRRSRIAVMFSWPSSLSSPASMSPVLVGSSHTERAWRGQEWCHCREEGSPQICLRPQQDRFSPLSGGWMEASTLGCPGRPAVILAFSAASKVAREG